MYTWVIKLNKFKTFISEKYVYTTDCDNVERKLTAIITTGQSEQN